MISHTLNGVTKCTLRSLMLFGSASIGIAGCAPAITAQGDIVHADNETPSLQTVGQILTSDPRFTDYVHIIDFAGLAHRLDDAHNVTVFAPTNAAFAHADPNWRATAVPDTNDNGWARKRQGLIDQSILSGVHPPSQFAGRMQDVRALNGSIFHIDGRQPGAISITTGPQARDIMGSRSKVLQVAKAEIPPITASDGIIYLVDNILIQ